MDSGLFGSDNVIISSRGYVRGGAAGLRRLGIDRRRTYNWTHTHGHSFSGSNSSDSDRNSDPRPMPGDRGTPKNLVKVDPALVGMTAGLKHLYSGHEDKQGRFRWQTTIPEDLGKPAEDAESEKWAIVVRNLKVYGDPKRVLTIHSIVVQSPYLKDLLTEVLEDYPGVTVGLRRLEFTGRFEPLIHRWDRLEAAVEDLKDKYIIERKNASIAAEASNEDSNVETDGDKGDGDKIAGDKVDHEEAVDKKDDHENVVDGNAKAELDESQPEPGSSEEVIENGMPKEISHLRNETAATTPEQDKPITKLDELSQRIEHAEVLLGLLKKEFADTIESSQDMKKQGVITYELLWTIFQPGALVYSRVQGQDRVWKLTSSKYGLDRNNNPVFWLQGQYVDYDGVSFGTCKLSLHINYFEGTKTISSLATLPFEFHGRKEEIRAKLIERGAKVEALAGSHYRAYNGVAWCYNSAGQKEHHTVNGRIIIDGYGWNRFQPNFAVYTQILHSDLPSNIAGAGSGILHIDDDYDEGYEIEGGIPIDGAFADESDNSIVKQTLTDEQKLICGPIVRGYALKERRWLNFFVNSVTETTFSTRAFDSLVLPNNQKQLILGFTSMQHRYRNEFDDVIAGKGKGVIILLCGPPGVGKTLTAESVAEEMQIPLFMMSAGDLGLDPRSVETKLQSVLDMCSRWKAILLLDEADIFLEQRSLHELERNKLVSIFLRVLEYYEGIMFLTTNRVETFDPAFESRIHISLEYKELDKKSRKKVWENFLTAHNDAQVASRERPLKQITSAAKASKPEVADVNKSDPADSETIARESEEYRRKHTQPHSFSEKDVERVADLKLNGRQIKNVLKTAQLLASQREEALKIEHVDEVMTVTQHLHLATQATEGAKSSIFS